MLKAVAEVKVKKTSIRRVAGVYGLPYQPLRDRISDNVNRNEMYDRYHIY